MSIDKNAYEKVAFALAGILVTIAISLSAYSLTQIVSLNNRIAAIESVGMTASDGARITETINAINQDLNILKTKWESARIGENLAAINTKIDNLGNR